MSIHEASRCVDTTPASGQLGTTEATLYTVPALRQTRMVGIIVSNKSATHTNTLSLFIRREGTVTSIRVCYVDLSPGDTAYVTLGRLIGGDMIRGMGSYAEECDYYITPEEELVT